MRSAVTCWALRQGRRAGLLALALLAMPLADAAPADLAAFTDGAVAAAMREHRVPGAVVAVVDRNGLLHGAGYGLAETATETPVDFAHTAFEVASISKLFTAIAVMQGVAAGTLDLDADVNTYLDGVRVPETFPAPVTLAHLLTHTAGFDERAIGMAVTDPADALPLAAFVQRRLPPRVRPAGTVASYSNMGIALAGLVVQQAAGVPFEEAAEAQILAPLGMHGSSFRRTPEVQARMATGYQYRGGRFVARPYNHMHGTPAGGLVATGSDMARFMLFCLNGGTLDGARILPESALEAMLARRFTHHPELPGMGIGFFRERMHGATAASHSGYLRGFATRLTLFPEEGYGIFVSTNGDATAFTGLVTRTLAAHLLAPGLAALPRPPIDGWEARATPFAGAYRPTRTGITSLEKLATLLTQPRLRITGPGVIVFQGERLDETRPGVFVHPVNGTEAALVRIPGERPIIVRDGWPFERLHWFETTAVQGAIAAVCLLVFASAVLWPFGWMRRPPHAFPAARSRFHRYAWLAPWSLSLLNAAFLTGLAAVMLGIEDYEFFLGMPPALPVLLALPLLAAALVAVLVPVVLWAAATGTWSLAARLHAAAVALAAAGFVPFLHHWNLLGFWW